MQIEPLALIMVGIGLVGWLAGPSFLIGAFFISTLLGAAAAVTLTSLGSANIQPAYLMLGFVALYALVQRRVRAAAFASLAFPKEGFWLAATALYAVMSAAFLPRIFAGLTYVYTIARTEVGLGLLLTPLAPSTGNITQTVYFIGDVVCFLAFAGFARSPAGLKAVATAGVVCAAANLLFAGLDLATYWTGTTALLGFLRNATYRMLDDAAIGDFKRIVGSFPEASTFAYYTVGLFAFCGKLWLARVWPRITGPIALLSLLALVFSTSSSGYAGLLAFLVALFLVSLGQLAIQPITKPTFAFVMIAPVLVLALIAGLRLHAPSWRIASDLVQQTVIDKLDSQSGVERSRWNHQALINIADTAGLGGGVGSVRASSFPIAVVGNIGVIGGLTYSAFLLGVLVWPRGGWAEPFPQACQSAARWACFAQLAAASVAGSFIDLGLPFFIFAGLAAASPEPAASASRRARLQPAAPLSPGVAA
jgi:hypothetical protein